jgi:protein-S-isoprenylcysteine O-methyltransferase Ste14
LVFVFLALIAYRFANGSHKLVLDNIDPSNPQVVTEDVYSLLRHPMYFAYIIGFIAFIQLTMSLLSIVPFIITFFLLNKIAAYEETELIRKLGQEYVDYMKTVPRWVPNPLKFLKRK